MAKPRVVETDRGQQGKAIAAAYDAMMRRSRDKGELYTDLILNSGITIGIALEIGCGPGYLGLEWLKQTNGTQLKGLDIGMEMVTAAEKNAVEYGLSDRAEYYCGDAAELPFDDNFFDAAFSNATLHEIANPVDALNELHRVLKPGGQYFITDLRRDMSFLIKQFMLLNTEQKELRPGFKASVSASYTLPEIETVLAQSALRGASVQKTLFGLRISGQKSID